MAGKNSFVVYTDWYDFIKELDTDEERSKLFLALFEYQSTKKEPTDFKGALKIVFMMMKSALDRDNAKYEETCKKRAAGGFKGGAPKGNKNALKNNHKVDIENENNHKVDVVVLKQLKQTKQPDNDNDNDNDNETDNENDNENESVSETDNDNECKSQLTEEQRFDLIRLSSVSSVDTYMSKIFEWQKKSGKKCKDVYATIRKWIDQDKAKGRLKDDSPPSYDLNEYESFARSYDFSDCPWNAKEG